MDKFAKNFKLGYHPVVKRVKERINAGKHAIISGRIKYEYYSVIELTGRASFP